MIPTTRPLASDDREPADAVRAHRPRGVLDRRVRPHRDDPAGHDVFDSHAPSPAGAEPVAAPTARADRPAAAQVPPPSAMGAAHVPVPTGAAHVPPPASAAPRLYGTVASSIATPHRSVTPAYTRPAPTNAGSRPNHGLSVNASTPPAHAIEPAAIRT